MTPPDADTLAVLRAAHRRGTLVQLRARVAKAGTPVKLARVTQIVLAEVRAGRLDDSVWDADTYYFRTKAGSVALKAARPC